MKPQKGFTIIELIVIISIIAVLAGIVLVNVTSYINKGKDAAIKGNLSSLMVNAAAYYDDPTKGNGDYVGFCATTGSFEAAIENASGSTSSYVCAETTTTGAVFCACSSIHEKSGTNTQYYCVDSTGNKNLTTTACSTACTAASPACQ